MDTNFNQLFQVIHETNLDYNSTITYANISGYKQNPIRNNVYNIYPKEPSKKHTYNTNEFFLYIKSQSKHFTIRISCFRFMHG